MKIRIFPEGMKFTPVYEKCPRCGLDLSKHFVDSGDYKKYANENEDKNANGHESFVPAVNHKLGKRIFHWLFGSGGNR